MGSSRQGASASPEFLHAFAARAGVAGTLRFDEFVDLALYDPSVGYYHRARPRVGIGPGTDFYTATTVGPVFGELICAACVALLGARDPEAHLFVEIGGEESAGVLGGISHPFRGTRIVKLGEAIELSGPLVVFSNELFDTQPFRRFRFRQHRWREIGVTCRDSSLVEIEFTDAPLPDVLPTSVTEGYTLDVPLAAASLAGRIAAQPWTGLFVACDYGKTWQELTEATPAGTARAYLRHTQSNDLLNAPGEQDLTCHVCWDWLMESLRHAGFPTLQVDTQESFFVHHAGCYIAPAIADDASRFTPRKQALLQLLHGAHMGQKFQVLYGLR